MENEYRTLMSHIRKPAGLNEKVLRAARDAAPASRRSEQERGGKPSFWNRPAFKLSACAVCAVALLLGGITLSKPTATAPATLDLSFGIAAWAADTGALVQTGDSRIAFELANSGSSDPEGGGYTGCLFRVTGENIKTVSASIDKGGLYRMNTVSVDRTTAEGEAAFAALTRGETPELQGCDTVSGYSFDEKLFRFDACWALGSSFSEDYRADSGYGFWVSPSEVNTDPDKDMQQAAHEEIDSFDGATLRLTVTFADGSQQTKTLSLHTGRLAVAYPDGADGPVLTGELAGDGEPYSYGIYADIE